MDYLDSPIDVAEYIRIYRATGKAYDNEILTRFAQGPVKFSATWQHDDYCRTMTGRVAKLREFMERNALPR